ncbi:uncharacterized protein LOC119078259 [Bradysia coprophila]|uniref:uncharacterized protein LOC119078259 n=1 Tax=Bradysia coprophila TaxID=38358 RepID=UPI00187D9934|nr:uncharacterized protein LOC119078259 [Bradysia coprophila]
MNFILTTNRRFGTIRIIRGHLTEDTQIREIFHRHGFNVVQLRCYGGRTDSLVAFPELLNLTPNLTNVVIETRSSIASSDDDVRLDHVLPAVKKLKNLEIFCWDQRIIKCFRKAKLNTLIIREEIRSEHYGSMIEFLSSQEMLTSLTAVSTWILDEVGRLNVPIPFRLTELRITHNYDEISSDYLSIFVRSQAQNLREIEMGWHIPSSVYECVFASMTKLNKLSVMVDDLPQDNDFYERLQENASIRTIKLLDSELNESQFVDKFLKKLPNIRNVLLPNTGYVDQSVLKVVAHNLSKLESLTIGSIYEHLIGGVRLPNLKTLHIRNLYDKINWNGFIKLHSQLVELTIESTHNLFSKLFERSVQA